MIEIILAAFVPLFVTIDPIGLAPLFVALTRGMNEHDRNRIALRACLIGAFVLAAFGLAGETLLTAVGIGLPAFRIAGGMLLFLIAVEMLFERRTQRREKTVDQEKADTSAAGADPSVFPLATPLIAGPGAITLMILMVGEHSGNLPMQGLIYGMMASVVLTAYILFRLSGVLGRVLGQVGINVVTRLLGMLLAALSVQFVINGLSDLGILPSGGV